jgi:hypothetical protein
MDTFLRINEARIPKNALNVSLKGKHPRERRIQEETEEEKLWENKDGDDWLLHNLYKMSKDKNDL